MFLKINVLISKRIAVNFHQHQFIIKFYQNFIINITISLKLHLIKRVFKISDKIIILLKSVMLILIFNILKKCQSQFNKNYTFILKKQLKLKLILLLAIMHTNI